MRTAYQSDKGYVYVGQWWSKYVAAYRRNDRRNAKPVCETGPVRFTEGMATDAAGNLYAATFFTGYGAGVATFGPNCGKPGITYEYYPGGWPQDPVVDGKTLFITSIDDSPYAATIGVFDLGGGERQQLSDPTNALGIGLAVDSHHNLFWSTNNNWSGGGQVIEFHRGRMPGKLLKATEIGTDYPGGVLVDASNNLLFIDQTTAAINIYAPPYDRGPVSKISLHGTAEYCALNPTQSLLYCLDEEYTSVDVYTYPKGTYLYSFTNGLEGSQGPVGIAVQPPATSELTRNAPGSRSSSPVAAVQEQSWMSNRAKPEDLLYISDEGTNDVHVFAWPKGDLVGKLTGFWYPQGECVDRAGNVFIVNLGKGNIVEYAHGGTTPIATLANGGETLVGCAVDPKTGNLAATNFGNGRQGAYVSVYRKARGRPTNYGFFYSGFTFCSYGDAGNLYADYFDWQSQGIGIAELPYQPGGAPGTKLLSISTQPGLKIPGGVQWDGKYLAVGDTYRDVVYRFVISGSNAIQANAALAGAPALNGGSRIMQFWIEGNLVVGSSLGTGNAMVWDYPNGGNEVKTLGGLTAPFGAVISPHKSLRVASVPR